mmetsp:Transcript_35992/g.52687  ORF Transcript_35992/g.52687 Transcript_35992/m.52687 type:complete len:415 (-) Transcript_35992:261-1505(-)
MDPLAFAYLLDHPGLLFLILMGCVISLIFTALRAYLVFSSCKGNGVNGAKVGLLDPAPWSVVCQILHLFSGIYMTNFYAQLCAISAGSDSFSPHVNVYGVLPSYFLFRLGLSANFYFMWQRAKVAEFQTYRGSTYKRARIFYGITCWIHFLANLFSLAMDWNLQYRGPADYRESCEGEWINVPFGNRIEGVSNTLQDLVNFVGSLVVFCESVATFLGIYLFWKPFRVLAYQLKVANQQMLINKAEMENEIDRAIRRHHELQQEINRWEKATSENSGSIDHPGPNEEKEQYDHEGARTTNKSQHNPESNIQQQQHDQFHTIKSVLYWNLKPAMLSQSYGFIWTSYLLVVISLHGGVGSLQLHCGHLLNTILLVTYYNLVFRDHLWVRDKWEKWWSSKISRRRAKVAACPSVAQVS